MPNDTDSKDYTDPDLELAGENDDDDDVIDLLQVVKPGKAVDTKRNENDEVDFSADLEAMLDSLSEAEKKAASGEEEEAFPDPTPVEHEVDHDEALDLPGMDDIDKLLEDLGEPGSDSGADESALSDADGGRLEEEALAMAEEIDGLDALPSTGAAALDDEDEPKQVEVDDDFLSELGLQGDDKPKSLKEYADTPKKRKAAKGGDDASPVADEAGESAEDFGKALDIDALIEAGPAKAQADEDTEKKAAPAPKAPAPEGDGEPDEVDLNELDALVDDVLAAAPPVVSSARASTPKEAAGEAEKPVRKSVENESLAALARASAAESLVESLREKVDAQAQSLASQGETLSGLEEKLDSGAASLEALAKELESLKQDVADQADKLQGADSNDDSAKELESALASVTARVDGAEQSMAEQVGRLQSVEQSVTGHAGKLKGMEQSVAAHTTSLKQLEQNQTEALDRLGKLESDSAAMQESFEALSGEADKLKSMAEPLESFQQRLEGVEQSLAEQASRLKDSENAMKETQKQIADYFKGVQEVVQNVSVLNDRMDALEGRFKEMQDNLEKAAASAAAKVIREEIAALLKEA